MNIYRIVFESMKITPKNLAIGAIVLIVAGGIAYDVAKLSFEFKNLAKGVNIYDDARSESQSQTSEWKTYTNSEYGFEVRYPKEWEVETLTANAVAEPIVRFFDPLHKGKSETDQPSIQVVVSFETVTTPTDWGTSDFYGPPIKVKTVNLDQRFSVFMMSFDEKSQKTEDQILSTFKPTSIR